MEALLGFTFGLLFWIWIIILIRRAWKSRKEISSWSKEDMDKIKKDAWQGIKDGIKTLAKHPFIFK